MTDLIKLPRMFFDDHEERALATPAVVKGTRTHVWIRRDDPAVPELLADAHYYADGTNAVWLRPGARAIVAALSK
jgi:hypothetical protein